MKLYQTLAAALTATALAAVSVPAIAQTAPELPHASQITDEDLQSFAAAAAEIETLIGQWRPQIEEAETPEQAAELGQQAQAEMVQAVESQGLTVEVYNHIAQLAQADPELQARVRDQIESR